MRDPDRTPGPDPDGDDLRHLFQEYSAGYEPEPDAIWDRFEDLRAGGTRHRGWSAGRARVLAAGAVSVAAAAALLVVMTRPPPQEIDTANPQPTSPVVTTAVPPSNGSQPATSDPGGESAAPTSAPGPSTPDATAEPPAATAPDPTTSVTAPAPEGSVQIAVEVLPAGLDLSAGGYRDWIVVGARQDGQLVTLAGREPLLMVEATGAPEQTVAPVDIRWIDGQPEASRAENGHWWSVPTGPVGFEIQAAATAPRSEIALYAGGTGQVVVTVTVDGQSSDQVAHLPDLPGGSGTGGYVRVGLSGDAQERDVRITLGSQADAGSVSLGAVTAR